MSDWPLIDDEDPYMRAAGLLLLVTGCYWLVAPFLMLSEDFGRLIDDLIEDLAS